MCFKFQKIINTYWCFGHKPFTPRTESKTSRTILLKFRPKCHQLKTITKESDSPQVCRSQFLIHFLIILKLFQVYSGLYCFGIEFGFHWYKAVAVELMALQILGSPGQVLSSEKFICSLHHCRPIAFLLLSQTIFKWFMFDTIIVCQSGWITMSFTNGRTE